MTLSSVLILTVGHDSTPKCVHMLCMTLSSVLILTVGHDSTPKCVHMLCMTLSSILILTVGHDGIARYVCVCAHVCIVLCEYVKIHSHRVHMYVFYKGQD